MNGPLLVVREQLAELGDSALFVGETTRPWLLGEAAISKAPETVRLTWEVSTDFGYAALLGRLDQLGFARRHPREPIGKRRLGDVLVSVEPAVPTLVGFVSLWHQSALTCPLLFSTPSGTIRVADLPHYLALELERWLALEGLDDAASVNERSATFERLLALFADQAELAQLLESSPNSLRRFVATECARWLAEEDFPATLRRLLSPGAQLSARWARASTALRRLAESAPAAVATPPPPAVVPDAPEVPLDGADVWRPRSGVIRAVAYDATGERLTVEFPRGAVYTYLGVPPLVFGAWRNSASPGNYHNDWIRDRYPFVRVR